VEPAACRSRLKRRQRKSRDSSAFTFKVKRHLNAQADHVAKANVERVSVPQAPQGVEDGTARFF
jgi:hypothetical protein